MSNREYVDSLVQRLNCTEEEVLAELGYIFNQYEKYIEHLVTNVGYTTEDALAEVMQIIDEMEV